ncbi:MAG: TetR/AcrR family transcriptional regulator [Clostridia bacterium]|nr:TetR/AcrR family transcriptional regulator [Clostridia bacterium]
MNTKNNKRRRESIKKIEKVFIELIQTKEISEISVSDICKRAELNRTTFYSNYIDIYDLADKMLEKLENEVKEIYSFEREHHYNSNNYLKLFQHIKDNQIFYKTYFKLSGSNQNKVYLYDIKQARTYFNEKHIKYHIEFFKAGFNAIVKIWLDNGCEETPEEMVEIINSEYQGRV